jgi:hypothetical protein
MRSRDFYEIEDCFGTKRRCFIHKKKRNGVVTIIDIESEFMTKLTFPLEYIVKYKKMDITDLLLIMYRFTNENLRDGISKRINRERINA